jgi:type I restriction enzyme, S subunit
MRDSNIPEGYKTSPLGVIPSDWEVRRIDEFAPLQRGFDLPVDDIVDGIYPVVFSNGILKKHNTFKVKAPGVVTGRSGTIGKVTFVEDDYWPHNTSLWVTDFKGNYPKYVFFFYDNFKLERFATGSGVPTLNRNDVHSQLIPIPPVSEQIVIAYALALINDNISKNHQLILKKELQKKALAQRLLTGKKRLKACEGEWSLLHLGELFKERNETGFLNLPLLSVGSNGIYRQTESTKIDTSNDDKSKYKRICPGDIGYNTMRMWQGRSALSKLEGIISPAYTVVTPKKETDATYFSYLFKTETLIHLFFRNSQGLVDDTLNCKFKDFANVKVWVPPYEEQTAIAKVLQTSDKEIQLLKAKGGKLNEQKKGMMQLLLTGKKRLKLTGEN